MRGALAALVISATALATSTAYAAAAPSAGPKPPSGVKGTVLFSPVCPVEQVPPDPACAPRPGAAEIRLVRRNGPVAAGSQAGPDGRFVVRVRPGHYAVEATASSPGKGCQATPSEVTVTARSYVTIDVGCDTGIR